MGYYTRFDGELTIDPPIPWKGEILESPFAPREIHWHHRERDVVFRIHEEEREVGEGTLVTRHAVALVPACGDEPSKSYNIANHVQEVVDAFPDHTFSGRIECAGENAGDLWRLEVHDRLAVRVKPQIVWPGEDD